MRFKPHMFQHSDDDPFATDKLKRGHCAEVLTQFISAVETPFVLALDSPWGTGKTTFLEMWMRYLRKRDFHCLSFNAWEHDYSGDPLLSFIGELGEVLRLKNIEKASLSKAKQHFESVKKYGGIITKRAIPVAIKLATAGIIDTDNLTEDALSSLAEKLANEKIEEYENEKKTVIGFKESLSKLVVQIQSSNEKGPKPLIFFIDELDRCRPTYTIELLEKIKHFFTVDGIIFILAIDKIQIVHSIRAVYGADFGAVGYLRRFIDHEYSFPEPPIEDFCHFLVDRFEFQPYFQKRQGGDDQRINLVAVFSRLATGLGFSLRVVEQCFGQFSIALKTIHEQAVLDEFLLASLVALKFDNKELYLDFIKGRTDGRAVVEHLSKKIDLKEMGRHGAIVEADLISIFKGQRDVERAIRMYGDIIQRHTDETQKKWPKEVLGFLEMMRTFPDTFILLKKKLEFLDRFVY